MTVKSSTKQNGTAHDPKSTQRVDKAFKLSLFMAARGPGAWHMNTSDATCTAEGMCHSLAAEHLHSLQGPRPKLPVVSPIS